MINDTVPASAVAALAVQRLLDCDEPVVALWVCVASDRDSYASEVRRVAGISIVPLVVRRAMFGDANAVLQDLTTLIEENQRAFDSVDFSTTPVENRRVAIVLLSRTPLRIVQAASPVRLPAWFPVASGQICNILIEDVSWGVEESLASAELDVAGIASGLHRLEGAMVGRLQSVWASKERNGAMAFMSRIVKYNGDALRPDECLLAASEAWHNVVNPDRFRPRSVDPKCVIAVLWRIGNETTPDRLGAPARDLARALVLADLPLSESLVAVIGRPSNPDGDGSVRGARSMLLTVRAACQLTTASAHADVYGRYPILALRALSYDLRRALDAQASLIEDLPPIPARPTHPMS